MVVKVTVKAMKNTIDENELFPARPVFGVLPKFPITNSELSTQKEKKKIPAAAQAEMNSVAAKRKNLTAVIREILPAANRLYKIEEKVLIYSGKEKLAWAIYFRQNSRKMITIQSMDNKRWQTFDTFQIKLYYRC